jgi:cytochrome d ubiquinol oxidase subunit II
MYSLEDLQLYWWVLVSIIGGFFVFMMFVQGGQTLLNTLAKTEDEKDLVINSLGRKWEIGFSSLVMFGGALFAAFPLFYAVSFGGAYYVWMSILFCFIIQAVSYEYRKKQDNFFGQIFYERLLFINGSLGIFLIGVALGTLYTGGNFIVNDMNLSHWTNQYYGLEALLNPFNIIFGLLLVLLSRIQALLYFYNSLDNDIIHTRIIIILKKEFFIFLPLFLIFIYMLLLNDGFSYDSITLKVYIESSKMFNNLLSSFVLLIILLLGIVMFLYSIYSTIILNKSSSIWFCGIGTILIVTTILVLLGINHTVIYPSLSNLQSSLTIQNSSGSLYTLEVMSVVSFLVPVVLTYIIFVWRAMDKEKLTIDEVKSDHHHY